MRDVSKENKKVLLNGLSLFVVVAVLTVSKCDSDKVDVLPKKLGPSGNSAATGPPAPPLKSPPPKTPNLSAAPTDCSTTAVTKAPTVEKSEQDPLGGSNNKFEPIIDSSMSRVGGCTDPLMNIAATASSNREAGLGPLNSDVKRDVDTNKGEHSINSNTGHGQVGSEPTREVSDEGIPSVGGSTEDICHTFEKKIEDAIKKADKALDSNFFDDIFDTLSRDDFKKLTPEASAAYLLQCYDRHCERVWMPLLELKKEAKDKHSECGNDEAKKKFFKDRYSFLKTEIERLNKKGDDKVENLCGERLERYLKKPSS